MNKSRECRATRRDIDEGVTGQLEAGTLRHLADCEPCRKFQQERAGLRELMRSLEPVTAPADFDIRLRARLTAQHTSHAGWFKIPRFAFGTPAVAVAATVLVILGGVALFNRLSVSKDGGQQTNVVQAPEGKKPAAPVMTSDQNAVIAKAPSGSTSLAVNPGQLSGIARTRNARVAPPDVTSSDLESRPAPVVRRGESQNSAEISLGKPFQFSLQDKQGVTRQITLPPLSFGSQQLVRGDRYQPVSYSNNRIW